MATPEGRVKNRVKQILRFFGPKLYAHWPVQTGYGAACLDCHACYLGFYFAIETKAPGKKLTKRQEITRDEILEAGGRVFVIGERETHDTWKYSGAQRLHEWLLRRSKS